MAVNLTWDLFFIVFFAVIIAYSCILGKRHTIKIIISTYIAILASDGLSNLASKYLIGENPVLNIFVQTGNTQIIVLTKIIMFIVMVVLLVTRGSFHVGFEEKESMVMTAFMTVAYAILSAGLIISTILIYASGVSILSGGFNLDNNVIVEIYQSSRASRMLINHYSAWFSLPAVLLVITSLISSEQSVD